MSRQIIQTQESNIYIYIYINPTKNHTLNPTFFPIFYEKNPTGDQTRYLVLPFHNYYHQGTNDFDDLCLFKGTSCSHFTTITAKALMILMTCVCFNVMHSTQILGPISFNLTIPKLFLTIMQLNLITITPPFLAGLINFYEK